MPSEAQVHDDVAAEAMVLLRELRFYLTARGLTATITEADWSLLAANPAEGRLSQRVVLAQTDAGKLCWYWRWGGKNEPVQHEPICHGLATGEVCERLERVLALRSA